MKLSEMIEEARDKTLIKEISDKFQKWQDYAEWLEGRLEGEGMWADETRKLT